MHRSATDYCQGMQSPTAQLGYPILQGLGFLTFTDNQSLMAMSNL